MSDIFFQIIQKKSAGDVNLANLWQQSLAFARASLSITVLNDQQLTTIAMNSATVDDFNLIAKSLYQCSKTHPDPGRGVKDFFQHVDDSDYSIEDWIKAIAIFHQWLKQEKLKSDFLTMLGYLACCSVSPENKTHKRDLCGLLQEMLDQYGFQAAVKLP